MKGTLRNGEQRIVLLANNTSVETMLIVEVLLRFENATIRLKEVLFIRTLGYNLVSTGRLALNSIESRFRRHDVSCELESDGKYTGREVRDAVSEMYTLPTSTTFTKSPKPCAVTGLDNNAELWHRRLANMNPKNLHSVHKFVDRAPNLQIFPTMCGSCQLRKFHKFQFARKFERSKAVGDVIHCDIMAG